MIMSFLDCLEITKPLFPLLDGLRLPSNKLIHPSLFLMLIGLSHSLLVLSSRPPQLSLLLMVYKAPNICNTLVNGLHASGHTIMHYLSSVYPFPQPATTIQRLENDQTNVISSNIWQRKRSVPSQRKVVAESRVVVVEWVYPMCFLGILVFLTPFFTFSLLLLLIIIILSPSLGNTISRIIT